MLGRLPWLALERRSRDLRFFVFFDIGVPAYGRTQPVPPADASGRRDHRGRADSMAATSDGSSGVTIGLNRVMVPSGASRNFSKFQRMSPLWP